MGRVFREAAQFCVEGDVGPASWLAVEERACRNRNFEHFFQAHRLSAKLDFIGAVRLGLAALVFDRKWTLDFSGRNMI